MKKKIVISIICILSLVIVACLSGFIYVKSQFKLTQSDIEKIVFKNAGVSSSDIKSKIIHKEFDDLKAVYEVNFTTSDAEYEYLVDAKTGSILEYDTENFSAVLVNSSSTTLSSSLSSQSQINQITVEEAKQIVFDDLEIQETDAQFLVVETDIDNGKLYYKVEFQISSKGLEYDYKIDAQTGSIVERNQDSIYD